MPQDKGLLVELYVSTLVPGMLLKGDCYDDKGVLRISAAKPVSAQEIDALKKDGLNKVYYTTSNIASKNHITKSALSDQSLSRAMTVLNEVESRARNGQFALPQKDIVHVVENFTAEISRNSESYLNLLELSNLDEYTYSHSINVSTLAITLGVVIKLENPRIIQLGVAGLLMDIGKSLIPQEVLNKQGNLTPDEWKLIRNHPVYGYNMLKNDPAVSKDVLDGVLLHHENYAGRGYPFGFTKDKMGAVPQILALVDTFDAATSMRPYRKPSDFAVIFSSIMQQSGTRFNPVYCQIFLTTMVKKLFDKPLYYEGCYVQLNTGEFGYVVGYENNPFTLRPIINIIFNPSSRDKVLKYHQQINLEKDGNRMIIRRIDEPDTVEKLIKVDCKGDLSCVMEKQAGIREARQS